MELYIDNQRADIDSRTVLAVSLSVAALNDITRSMSGYTKTIVVPATPLNRFLTGQTADMFSVERFNSEHHRAAVQVDSSTVVEGVVQLVEAGLRSVDTMSLRIIGAGKWWAVRAGSAFNSIPIVYEQTLTKSLIEQSWSIDTPVRFLPVQRDRYTPLNSSSGVIAPARILTITDYHPFLHIRSLVDAIFASSGFTVSSEFMDGDYFRSLYMSGNYPSANIDSVVARMDFLASRYDSASAVADYQGRVAADPLSHYNTVGNIVQTADADQADSNGNRVAGVFSNNGCLREENSRIVFDPLESVTVAFELRLSYTTDYTIATREQLKGFNVVNLNDNDQFEFVLPNSFVDLRERFAANHRYRIVVFFHMAADSYRLVADEVINPNADINNLLPSDVQTVTVAEFNTRTAEVGYTTQNRMANLRLEYRSLGIWVRYMDDWALYEGYVDEQGKRDVQLTLRTTPQTCSPSSPATFDRIWFGGANEGMTFTLHSSTTLSPVFASCPTIGSHITFADVAAHDFTQADLIKALRQMFNLCFYTDPVERKVIIEPFDSFCSDSPVEDWSDRIDFSSPIGVSLTGDESSKHIVLGYQTGDGAVGRWNVANSDFFGSFDYSVDNLFASDTPFNCLSPLFTPSVNLNNLFSDSPSSSLVQAGDRDSYLGSEMLSLNFKPKIVRYFGLQPLPEGELWSWPSFGTAFPFAAFHNSEQTFGERFTLCFEDRDGCEGLHKGWDQRLDMIANSKCLTLFVRLSPDDIERFVAPNHLKRDFRALYRLTLFGESSLYRLEQICDYNPQSVSTKCRFIKV